MRDIVKKDREMIVVGEKLVESKIMVSSMDKMLYQLGMVLMEAAKSPEYKILVFFPTFALTDYVAQLFQTTLFPNLLCYHRQRAQELRIIIANKYNSTSQAIIFTSDFEGRPIDYPEVSHIFHFCLPHSMERFVNYRIRNLKHLDTANITYIISDWEYQTLYPSVFAKFAPPETIECFPENAEYTQMKEKIDAERLPEVGWLWAFWTMIRFFYNFKGVDQSSVAREVTLLFTAGMGRSSEELELDRSVAEQMGLTDVPGLLKKRKNKAKI